MTAHPPNPRLSGTPAWPSHPHPAFGDPPPGLAQEVVLPKPMDGQLTLEAHAAQVAHQGDLDGIGSLETWKRWGNMTRYVQPSVADPYGRWLSQQFERVHDDLIKHILQKGRIKSQDDLPARPSQITSPHQRSDIYAGPLEGQKSGRLAGPDSLR